MLSRRNVTQLSLSELGRVHGGIRWDEAHAAGKAAAWDQMVDILEGGRELGERAGRNAEPFGMFGATIPALFAGGGTYVWNAGKNVVGQLRE
jgi:hypothetical protein